MKNGSFCLVFWTTMDDGIAAYNMYRNDNTSLSLTSSLQICAACDRPCTTPIQAVYTYARVPRVPFACSKSAEKQGWRVNAWHSRHCVAKRIVALSRNATKSWHASGRLSWPGCVTAALLHTRGMLSSNGWGVFKQARRRGIKRRPLHGTLVGRWWSGCWPDSSGG